MKAETRIRLFDLAPGREPDPIDLSCWEDTGSVTWEEFRRLNEDGSPAWVADVENSLDAQGWHLGDEGAGGIWMAQVLKEDEASN